MAAAAMGLLVAALIAHPGVAAGSEDGQEGYLEVVVTEPGTPGVCPVVGRDGVCFTNEATANTYVLADPVSVESVEDALEALDVDVGAHDGVVIISAADVDLVGDLLRAVATVKCTNRATTVARYSYDGLSTMTDLSHVSDTTCTSHQRVVALARTDHSGIFETRSDDDRDESTNYVETRTSTNAPVTDAGVPPSYWGPGSAITYNGDTTFVNFRGDITRLCYRGNARVGGQIDGAYISC